MTLYSFLKNIFWLGTILVLAPLGISIVKEQYYDLITPGYKVGIITINDAITTAQPIIKHINHFFKDNTIKGIIINIECKGGALGSTQVICHEIEILKKKYPKPIIALIENNCIAEGYLIACATDVIISSGAALIGGIQSSPDYTQSLSEDIYSQIITTVAHRRKISMKEHDLWASGHTFTGNQAHKLHLIDTIGSISNAENIIKEKTLLEGDIQWIYGAQESYFYNFVHMLKQIFVL